MEVRVQLHAQAALPPGKIYRYPLEQVWTLWSREKYLTHVENRTLSFQPVIFYVINFIQSFLIS
jgi:hypothetical protein